MRAALDALRFALWRALVATRLRRLGGRLEVSLAGAPPRLRGLPHVDLDGRPGRLVLRFGERVTVGRDAVLDLADGRDGWLELRDDATLQDRVRLQPWGGVISVGDGTQVRDGSELKSSGELRLGPRTLIGRGAVLHCHEAVAIGADVALGPRVTVLDSDHGYEGPATPFLSVDVRSARVAIGVNALVGAGAVVLKGSTVGDGAMLAAGAVLAGGEVPPGQVAAGVPARAVGPR